MPSRASSQAKAAAKTAAAAEAAAATAVAAATPVQPQNGHGRYFLDQLGSPGDAEVEAAQVGPLWLHMLDVVVALRNANVSPEARSPASQAIDDCR